MKEQEKSSAGGGLNHDPQPPRFSNKPIDDPGRKPKSSDIGQMPIGPGELFDMRLTFDKPLRVNRIELTDEDGEVVEVIEGSTVETTIVRLEEDPKGTEP